MAYEIMMPSRGLQGERDVEGNFKPAPQTQEEGATEDQEMSSILQKVQGVLTEEEFNKMLKYMLSGGMK